MLPIGFRRQRRMAAIPLTFSGLRQIIQAIVTCEHLLKIVFGHTVFLRPGPHIVAMCSQHPFSESVGPYQYNRGRKAKVKLRIRRDRTFMSRIAACPR